MKAFNCPNCGAAIAPDSVSCSYCRSVIATRLCPSCFGAVSVGMRHCPHCGAQAADSKSGTAGPLRCPHCEIGLAAHSVGQKSLNMCTKCGGLWIEKTVFQSICTREEEQEAVLGFQCEQPKAPGAPEQKSRRTYIPCPGCGKLMNRKNFSGSGIVLEWCRDHGSWFDYGELQQIVRFIRDGGMKKAREREQQKLKDQEDRLRMQEFSMAALERRLDARFSESERPGNSDSIIEFLSRMF